MSCCGNKTSAIELMATANAGAPAKTLRSSLAGVEPVLHQTRDAVKADILHQRESAEAFTRDLNATGKQRTRVASISAQPRSNRMSRLNTMARGELVKTLQKSSKESSDGAKLTKPNMGSATGLKERLHSLGLDSVEMEGDGNCQFRSIADQLFGSQQHHELVRAMAIAHMRAAADFFGMYFETEGEFESYLRNMARSRTWGDELTLRACVEAFGCIAHVITSESMNWYLMYTPESAPDEAALAQACARKRLPPPKPKKEIFISYISPIHYNAIAALSTAAV